MMTRSGSVRAAIASLTFSTIKLGGDQVVDADVMLDAARQQLVLDLDRRKAGRLRQRDRPVDVHRIAPAAAGIEHDRQPADRAHVDGDLGKLGQREIGLGDAFEPAERAAAQVDRLEARILGEPRHDRIERARRDDQLVARHEFTKIRQDPLPLTGYPDPNVIRNGRAVQR